MSASRRFAISFLTTCLLSSLAAAQSRDPVSPGVGRAVLLATNSIQIERDTDVVSGDVIVNDTSPGPFLGEAQLSLDQGVITAAASRLMADSIDVDRAAVVHGDVYYNTLTNAGTIEGARFKPLALPVFSRLPQIPSRPAGTEIVTVPAGATLDVPEGAYTLLNVGNGGVARLTGTGYTFTAVSVSPGGAVLCTSSCNVLARLHLSLGAGGSISGPDPAGVLWYVGGESTTGPVAEIGRNATEDVPPEEMGKRAAAAMGG